MNKMFIIKLHIFSHEQIQFLSMHDIIQTSCFLFGGKK